MAEIRTYISGATATTDFAGTADAGLPVGVQIHEVTATVEAQIAAYTKSGGKVFCDSGAFRAFTKGGTVDFNHVLDRYADIARISVAEHLAVVAPDVIGDMSATAELQILHLDRIAELAATGVEIMFPLQCGWPHAAYVTHCELLREKIGPFTLAFAANMAAWSPRDLAVLVARIRPARVHLLGVGTKNLDAYSDAVLWNSPGTALSSDANRLRVFLGEGRSITEETRKGMAKAYGEAYGDFDSCYDGTELDYDLHNSPSYLLPDEAKELARLFGISDKRKIELWATWSQQDADVTFQQIHDDGENSFGCKLGYLLQEADPCGYLCQTLVHSRDGEPIKEVLAGLAAKRRQSELRRKAITTVMAQDNRRRQAAYRERTSQLILFKAAN